MSVSQGADSGAGPRATRCGFIGLGSQGAPIARRMIDAGFATTLWARRPATLAPFRQSGARFAATIAELGAAAEHVGICVVNDGDVREVCGELIPAMAPGGRIAIHATVHPETVREVARKAAERGIDVIDAPVSGGSPAAEAGTLTLMLGGDPDTIAAALPVFESFGGLIVRLGALGAGQHAKLINNALLAANIGLADMALKGGTALGLDRPMLLSLLLESSGRSFGLGVLGRMAEPSDFARSAALLRKDMDLLDQALGADAEAVEILQQAGRHFLAQSLAAQPA